MNKIAQLLFFISLSATVVGLICARTKAKRWWTGGLGLLLSAVLLTGYFMPVSVPVMDLSASSVFADAAYYETIHAGKQRNVAADFRVKKYRLDFSMGLNLTGRAKVYVDRSELKSYRFTLYHGYKVKRVTDQTGAALDFRRELDYVTVTRGGAAVEYLCLEYTGSSPQYYSGYAGACLPANFAYYPIPGIWSCLWIPTTVLLIVRCPMIPPLMCVAVGEIRCIATWLPGGIITLPVTPVPLPCSADITIP